LSDSHISIFEERNACMTMKTDYDKLLVQDRNDEKRIHELQALSEDIENSQLFINYKDVRPQSTMS
jgi:hypothetical protein